MVTNGHVLGLWHLSLWITAREPAVSRYQRGPELLGKLYVPIHQTLGVASRPGALPTSHP